MRRPLAKARNKDMIMSSNKKDHETHKGVGGDETGIREERSERTQIKDVRGGSSSSIIPIGKADISSTRNRKSNDSQLQELIFPKRLMAILADPANADCIRWGHDGSSFFILDKDIFARKIMPRLSTRRAKFSSFVRKLNRWGFSFVTKGLATGHYRHDYFHRDKPFLVSQMYYHNSRAKEALKGTGGRSISSGDEKPCNQVFDDNKVSSDRNIVRDARIECQLMASSSHHNCNASMIPHDSQGGSQSSAELKDSSEKSVVLMQRSLTDLGQPDRENPVFAEQPIQFLHHRLTGNPLGVHTSPSLHHRRDVRNLIDSNDGGVSKNDQDPRQSSWNSHALGVVPGSRCSWPNNFDVGEQNCLIRQAKEMEFARESLSQSLARAPANPLVILNDTRLQQEGNLHLSGLPTIAGYNDPLQFLNPHQRNISVTNHDERLGQFGQRISGSMLPHLSFPGIHTPMIPGDRLPLSLDCTEILQPSAAVFLESPQLALMQQSMMGFHQNLPQSGAVRPVRLAETTSLLNLDLRPFLPSSMYPIGNSQPSSQEPSGVRNYDGGDPSVRHEGAPRGDEEKLPKHK